MNSKQIIAKALMEDDEVFPDELIAGNMASFILSALKEAGFKVARVDPTEKMIKAASEAKPSDGFDFDGSVSVGDFLDFSGENKTRIVLREALLQAMIAAQEEDDGDH